ncbi:MAG: sulfite exporter TauE/SafE family protein [Deltaproteobacteria bacterium]
MSFDLYLPIARHSVDIFLLLGLGAIIGSFSGIFGVGGGFLMTPLLIMAGIPPTVAAASDSNQIIAAAASGSYAHYRMGHVDIKMGLFLLAGNLVGGTLGVEIIKVLRRLGEAGFLIKATYVVLLSLVGTYMLVESIKSLRKAPGERKVPAGPPLYQRLGQALPWQMYFKKSGVALSPLLPLILGGVVGLLAGIMGLGGGFIMVPLMFYLLGMPMHLVVGTNLFQEAFLCANVTFVQVVTNHVVDLMLALALAVGSGLGAQFGSRFSRKVRGEQLRFLLAVIILAVMIKIFLGLVLHPHYTLDVKGIG